MVVNAVRASDFPMKQDQKVSAQLPPAQLQQQFGLRMCIIWREDA